MNPRELLAAAAVASLAACGSDPEPASIEAAGSAVSAATVSAATVSAATQAAGGANTVVGTVVPAACDLVPRAEIERLAGPLDGEPKREDRGCWYYVAMDTTSAEWTQLRANAERARASGMDARAIELYHPSRAGVYVEVNVGSEGQAPTGKQPAGWDEASASRSGAVFNGRAGHVQGHRPAAATSAASRYGRRHREPGARPHPRRSDRAPRRGPLAATAPRPGSVQRAHPRGGGG